MHTLPLRRLLLSLMILTMAWMLSDVLLAADLPTTTELPTAITGRP